MAVRPEPCIDIEAEQAVLGAILVENSVYGMILGDLSEDDFSEPSHRAIWRACAKQIAAGRVATPQTLRPLLPDTEIVPGMTVSQYLSRLCTETTGTLTARTSALTVKELAQMREVIAIAEDLQYARAAQKGPPEALREAWDRLDGLRGASGAADERGSLRAFVERAQAARREGKETSQVVSTGMVDLDKMIGGGWRSRRLYVGAGRPGMGKTVFGCSTARRVAKQGVGVLIQSLELDGSEIRARITADQTSEMLTNIEYSRILAGDNLTPEEIEDVERAEAIVADLPIEVDATGGISMIEIEARARVSKERMARRGIRLGLVVIDYLGLIRRSDRYRGNAVSELGEIAMAAKTMAKRLDTAVLLLCQLNRGVEQRDDKRPKMSDLRASGEIEEHADVVALMYRGAYYSSDTADVNKLEVILGKNRLGPTKPVELWCCVELSTVGNIDRIYP